MKLIFATFLLIQIISTDAVLDNDFVRVVRNHAPCADGAPPCGERVLVALGPIAVNGKKMKRGDVKGFKAGEAYSPPPNGEYLEMVIKPGHPSVAKPAQGSPPEPDNRILYDGGDFFVAAEKMKPGETSSQHSHNQRVAISLNRTQVQQWTNGKSEIRELLPDDVAFRPAVVHMSKDLGTIPIENLLIEFRP